MPTVSAITPLSFYVILQDFKTIKGQRYAVRFNRHIQPPFKLSIIIIEQKKAPAHEILGKGFKLCSISFN
ncbi:MAG: hypothetical protein JRE23_17640 [Deltaproteobacteria bacterium]|nr:hypothetical protein [Deltaproteobacteria bacterium]